MERATNFGLLQAVLDPRLNAIHVSLLRERPQVPVRTREYLAALANRLLREGPAALTPAEMKTLLWDAEAMLGHAPTIMEQSHGTDASLVAGGIPDLQRFQQQEQPVAASC